MLRERQVTRTGPSGSDLQFLPELFECLRMLVGDCWTATVLDDVMIDVILKSVQRQVHTLELGGSIISIRLGSCTGNREY
jgi:hypothetical protein